MLLPDFLFLEFYSRAQLDWQPLEDSDANTHSPVTALSPLCNHAMPLQETREEFGEERC